MATAKGTPGATDALRESFRSSIEHLAGSMPVSVGSISLRPVEGGPLDALLTLGFDEAPGLELPPLVIGEAAVQWFEANRKELVLVIRPDHVRSEFYRPFTRHGLRTVLVVPVFRDGSLVGSVAVGSVERDAYTKRHLKLVELLAAELSGLFPTPRPAPISAAVEPAPAAPEKPASVPEPASPGDEAHISADALGRVAEWDRPAEHLFGIPREEALADLVTLFYRPGEKHLIDPGLIDELLSKGTFRGRALCYDTRGLPVTCEVELSEIRTPGGARGFRGRFRRVLGDTLLPREDIRFAFARLYAFNNPLR